MLACTKCVALNLLDGGATTAQWLQGFYNKGTDKICYSN